MMKSVALVLLLAACVFGLEFTQIAERHPYAGRWEISRANSSDTISFKILLKQRNLDKLDAIFWEVSDPQHANYGKFLTTSQLNDLIAPNQTTFKNVYTWLAAEGINKTSIFSYPTHIHVVTSVKQAAKLFKTEFAKYTSSKTGKNRTRILGAAHIPTNLTAHIDFVSGISELIDDTRIAPKSAETRATDNLVTPANTTQAIGAFADYYSDGAYKAFNKYFGINGVEIQASGPNCLNEGQPCDQLESDLDVQYITSMGYGASTEFIAHDNGEWILDWALQLSNRDDAPLVNSLSYGFAEYDQCLLTNCNAFGYSSEKYVLKTDTILQALGAKGLTILVSSGDDGAPSLGEASGNCPIDNTKYCVSGGCQHTSTKCGGLTFTLESNNTMCFFPMGSESDACAVVLTDKNINNALNGWASENSECTVAIESDSFQNRHVYSSCECSQLKSYSSHGINVAPYTFSQSNGAVFSADYPTSSPYVTSVGATQFTWNGKSVSGEIAASIDTGAIITTGGGFSSFNPQPSYQKNAVANYLASGVSLPPSFSFNAKMRAYPDITLNGHNYLIFGSNNNNNQNTCPCASTPVDGTSCSTPALAGTISLINDKLLNLGKSQLGFLNPLLYAMAENSTKNFNDITKGNNNCNRAYCCEYGFEATQGWDPVSGLGSIVFPHFESFVLSVKGV